MYGMITPTQMRSARAMLDYSQSHVAAHLGIAANTLSKIESGQIDTPASRSAEIQNFYERSGVEFIKNEGVRWKKSEVRKYEGKQGFFSFMLHVYETVTKYGGPYCVANVDERDWLRTLGEDVALELRQKTKALSKVEAQILVKEGDWNFTATDYAKYMWLPEDVMGEAPFYIYGDNLAFIQFAENVEDTKVYVLEQSLFAKSFKKMFDAVWKKVAIQPTEAR
jgi:transcriptional regulator with XRE-family HTH domain